jgi:hypothetical protein
MAREIGGLAVAVCGLATLFGGVAHADMTVVATGHVTAVNTHKAGDGSSAPDHLGAVGIHVGDGYTSTLVYDPSTPAQFLINPNPTLDPLGNDGFYPAAKSLLMTVHGSAGDVTFGLPDATVYAHMINVSDRHNTGTDFFSAGSSGGLPSSVTPVTPTFPGDSKLRFGLYFRLEDATHGVFDTAAVPTTFYLPAFTSTNVGFSCYYDGGGGFPDGDNTDFSWFGTVESITPAPDPSLCSPGSYSTSDGLPPCTSCPAGGYTRTPGATSCNICSPGSYAPNETATSCAPCDPGYFQTMPGSIACNACSPGTYAFSSGFTQCSVCPNNRIAPSSASSACTLCPAGTTNNTDHTACVATAPAVPATTGWTSALFALALGSMGARLVRRRSALG